MVKTEYIDVSMKGYTDIRDITPDLKRILDKCQIKDGIITVFVPGSTGGLTTMEYEPGLLKDLPEVLEKIAPQKASYHHHATWSDDNGAAHIRSALIGPSITIPFKGGNMALGTWQQVVFLDFDTRPRNRRLVIQILGE
jgi:secondary thiamine-phosphate synthase enzyme